MQKVQHDFVFSGSDVGTEILLVYWWFYSNITIDYIIVSPTNSLFIRPLYATIMPVYDFKILDWSNFEAT